MNEDRRRQIERLHHAALERRTEERAAFLVEICHGDDELRREIELLLAQNGPASRVLDRLTLDGVPTRANLPAQTRLAPGAALGPYKIEAHLGAGGMGEVFRARDTRLGRTVAIKVLPQDKLADAERKRRFLQEARAASALNHPNIVLLYDISSDGGTDFLVLEYVPGKTLAKIIPAQGMPIAEMLSYATQVANALAAAHAAGIVHRDIKPANIMVTSESRAESQAKILDFGLAKLEGRDETQASQETMGTVAGMLMGTVAYMSPEQAGGHVADYRSDQFSFGVVLYEMATGKQPFHGRTAVETLTAILREKPDAIAKVNPQVPTPLIWIIERCLEKNPADRYAASHELARDLATLHTKFSSASLDVPKSRPLGLPAQRTPLIGRRAEIAAVRQLLLNDNVRLVTFTGPPGTGKTRLALQVGEELTEHFGGNVFFAALAPVTDPGLVASAIAQALDLRLTGGRTLAQASHEYLRDSRIGAALLILDNFEQVLAASPLVTELLAACQQLKVLVTSRAPLRLYGEHEFPVPTLLVPDLKRSNDIETIAQQPAVALFLERAKAAKPDFISNAESVRAAAEICVRLDGLPLAIELAAARIKMLPPAALLSRLEHRLQLLTSGPRDLPARQQTLRGAIDWSFSLLSEAEQRLFRRLAAFVGGWTLEATEAVCDARQDLGLDVFEGLASLVDKSLVRQVEVAGEEPRFIMLETIREYALERLSTNMEEENFTRRAHAAYCIILAEEGKPQTVEEGPWLFRLDVELDNIRGAFDWLIQTGNADWGLRLGAAMRNYWWPREYAKEGRERLEAILKLPGAQGRTKTRAMAAAAAGVLAYHEMNYPASQALNTEATEILRELSDTVGLISTLNNLSGLAIERQDYVTARVSLEECIDLCRQSGDAIATASTLSNLANLVRREGDLARAASLYEECRLLFSKAGDQAGLAWTANHQGDLARNTGDAESARRLYDEGLTIFRELSDNSGIASSLTDLGGLAYEQDDPVAADCLYQEALKVARQSGYRQRHIARLLEDMAGCAARRGLDSRALRLAGAAEALRQILGVGLMPAAKIKLDRSLESSHRTLGDEAARSWMAGWEMSPEAALNYALEQDV